MSLDRQELAHLVSNQTFACFKGVPVTDPQAFHHRPGVAVVVGATGGLGEACARLLAARGARALLTYRTNRAHAEGLAQELEQLHGPGACAGIAALDVLDPQAARTWAAQLADSGTAVHTLVYAAGPHVPQVHLSKLTPEQFRRQIDDDLVATFNVLTAFLSLLRASHGSIVALSTAATDRYASRDGLSAIPKGGVEQIIRGIAVEEGRFGVRANSIGIGMNTAGMAQRLMAAGDLDEVALEAARKNTPLRRFGSGDDIAQAACFLASDAAGFISGQRLNVDGGYSA